MTDVDVLVVGGGPVGLASAIEARLAGLTVALVEPRDGDIDKACGEGLMPGALPLLARLGVDPDGMPLRGVSYRTETRRADHLFRSGEGRGVRRTTLHRALADRATELGITRVAARVEAVLQTNSTVTAAGLTARYLLAGDGLHSSVRRQVGLERAVRGSRRFGLRRHFAVAPWNDLIEVHWTREAEVYITPIAPDLTGVAVLGPPRTDFDTAVEEVSELAERLAGVDAVTEVRGAGPFRQRAKARTAGRVLLVGDASGYVDAITGEGLRLGFEQAAVAVAAVADDTPTRYEREWRRVTRDFRVLTHGLVAAAGSPLRGGIVPAASALPGLYGAIVERLAR
ncbi:MAG TPA: FAD-dependent monooxygenase [Rhodoglobus sp.]|nr:FAD-dependent monooxygenase [Rhodoglobus sp.]